MKSILDQLPSSTGENWKSANSRIALQCILDPELLLEISHGLSSDDPRVAGHCAEIFTFVADENPHLVTPYADTLISKLSHKFNRVRWECMHAIGLIAHLIPSKIEHILDDLNNKIHHDKSVIVIDWSVKTVSTYAGTSVDASKNAYPILVNAISVRDGRHAHHALFGLEHVAKFCPELVDEIIAIAEKFEDSKRGVLKKAAKKLLKNLD